MSKKGRSSKHKRLKVDHFHVPYDRIMVYLIAAFVFSLPLFIWPTVTEYGYGKTIFAIVGVSILLILWGISALAKKEWSIRLPWLVYPALGLIVVSLLSLINATNGRVVIQSLVLVVVFFLFYLVVSNFVKRKEDVNLILYALLASAFLASLYGLLQYLGVMRGAQGGHGLNEVEVSHPAHRCDRAHIIFLRHGAPIAANGNHRWPGCRGNRVCCCVGDLSPGRADQEEQNLADCPARSPRVHIPR